MSRCVCGSPRAVFRRDNFVHGTGEKRAAVQHHLLYLLTSGSDGGSAFYLKPAAVARDLVVCVLELRSMARGGKPAVDAGNGNQLPRFIDIKLSPEARETFKQVVFAPQELVQFLTDMAADGYRVGCAYSGESGAFTVSLTCRDVHSPNNGLCMTSFARDLPTAVALAAYKHNVIAAGVWPSVGSQAGEEFG